MDLSGWISVTVMESTHTHDVARPPSFHNFVARLQSHAIRCVVLWRGRYRPPLNQSTCGVLFVGHGCINRDKFKHPTPPKHTHLKVIKKSHSKAGQKGGLWLIPGHSWIQLLWASFKWRQSVPSDFERKKSQLDLISPQFNSGVSGSQWCRWRNCVFFCLLVF